MTLVGRILSERLDQNAEPVKWLVPARGYGPRPAPIDVLRDETLLGTLVSQLLQPVTSAPESRPATDLVILAVDADQRRPFERTVDRVREQNDAKRVVSVVFEPELEILFLQGKEPLEDALGLSRCSSEPPPRSAADPKDVLRRWVNRFGPNASLDAKFRERIVTKLDLSDQTPLTALRSYRKLVSDLDAWRA